VVSGLESDTQPVSTINPIAFGTHGLYLQFPDNFAPRTEWEIPIPNVHSSVYLINLNAYNYALENRNVAVLAAENAVKSAEASLVQVQKQFAQVSGSARDERIAAQEALVEQMQAAVLVAQVSHNNTIIKAPFSGTVIDISAEVGEIVMGATSVISLVSNEDFELLVNISESDIQEIGVGDVATVTFDAYKELSLEAYVTSISPSANVIEGVRVFETRLQFKKKNDLIRIGLSADIDILAETKTNVIAVPSRSIVEEDSAKFVRTLVNNKLELLPVTVGLHGSNGMTEVISGLTEGQEIITFAQEEVLSQLESN
jgi:HlyD family secretion protein